LEKTNDENIGIKLPCDPAYIPDKVIYMLIWNSKSPLDAMKIACKYVKLITTTFAAIFTEDESNFSIEFIPSSQWILNRTNWKALIKTTLDVSISTVQNTFPKMFSKELNPLEIRLTIERPADDAVYYELFQCPIYFGDQRNIMVYDKSILQKEKNSYYDKKTYDSIVQYADDLIRQQINQNDGFYIIVENEILTEVGGGKQFPNIGQIARNLSMSVRSFQRKLDKEGLNYKEVLDSVRKNFAMNFIKAHEDYNVNELSDTLGYSDASAFIKAFKRWFGVTPGKFRTSDDSN
jgi:AraC-like DNA-binding protein